MSAGRLRLNTYPTLWLRWVGANGLAELIGLGATFGLDFLIITSLGEGRGFFPILVSIILFTLSGVVEGFTVGGLQWLVLRQPFPAIHSHDWIRVTVIGAMIAWFFGSLPSMLMDFQAQQSGTPVAEPDEWVVLTLAAGMGLVLGVVLAYPQWRVLKRHVPGAWLWLPANSLAWALGMPVIFAAMDVAFSRPSLAGSLAVLAVALLLAGVIVGAIHGLALLRLAWRTSPDQEGQLL